MKRNPEICAVCGTPIPWNKQPNGIYYAEYRVRICLSEECSTKLDALTRDYSQSKRGRRVPRSVVLKNLDALK